MLRKMLRVMGKTKNQGKEGVCGYSGASSLIFKIYWLCLYLLQNTFEHMKSQKRCVNVNDNKKENEVLGNFYDIKTFNLYTPNKKECSFSNVSDYKGQEDKYAKAFEELKIIVRMKNLTLLKTPLKNHAVLT